MTTTTTKTRSQANVQTGQRCDISKNTVAAMGVLPAAIGIWAGACFVGGLVASGGPLALARSFFQAVTGM